MLVPEYSLTVEMQHLQSVEPELAELLNQKPNDYLPWFENAVVQLAK